MGRRIRRRLENRRRRGGALFSADASYHPWEGDDALRGRAAIITSWPADRDEASSWSAKYRPWAIEGDRAVAVGTSRYLAVDGDSLDREYHNAFLCRFDDDGRCSEFTELYLARKSA